MPRRYDTALLEKMNANARCVTHEGVEVLLKPIPEGGAPGDMDPRLYKSMRLMPLMVHFMPKTKPSATPLWSRLLRFARCSRNIRATLSLPRA